MSERYTNYVPTATGRSSSTYNPARSSMPTSIGYSSVYAGDMHVVPSASHRHHITPRAYYTSTDSAGVPTSTTRTYKINPGSRANSNVRDNSRNRRSTLDTHARSPVIVMTTQMDRSHASSAPRSSSGRSASPVRDDYRASDGQVYSQPASSIRSRPSAKRYHYHGVSSSEDHGRYRERGDAHLSSRDLEDYRTLRPSVVYPSDPRHSTAAIDYGDEGYQYTTAGELVKYDLDQSKPGRSSRRRNSNEAGYHRPNINYDSDRRNTSGNASQDPSRGASRQTESRGPPPSTRGFDKINRAYDSRDVLPSAPVPPSPTGPGTQLELPSAVGGRRPRPLSLHQDDSLHSSHHDDYYRSRDDERTMRDLRDRDRDRDFRESERRLEPVRYHDEGVTSRGFGIRTDLLPGPAEAGGRRQDTRPDDRRKRSDEELRYGSDKDKEIRHRGHQIAPGELKDRRSDARSGVQENWDQRDRSRSRHTLATGLAAAAAAAAATTDYVPPPPNKAQDRQDHENFGPKRRRSPPEEREAWREETKTQEPSHVLERVRDSSRETRQLPPIEREVIARKEPLLIREKDPGFEKDLFPLRDRETSREKELVVDAEPIRGNVRGGAEPDRRRSAFDHRVKGENARLSGSDSDDTRRSSRRHRASAAFDPNDASDLRQLKEQLASLDVTAQPRERQSERLMTTDGPRVHSPSPSRERVSAPSSHDSYQEEHELRDEMRGGRDLVAPAADGKQVRLVSPPRDKDTGKPLKGILKQPKVSFPEEANPVREGVAPHKEDKKLKEVPPGARWTKINRRIVNPEALEVGRERFEVRDDFVIVLRVLNKEEIQAYAAATQVLRERRRNKSNPDKERERELDRDRDDDDGNIEDADHDHARRRRREGDVEETEDRDAVRDRERTRDDGRARDPDQRHHGNPRSFRQRDRDRAPEGEA